MKDNEIDSVIGKGLRWMLLDDITPTAFAFFLKNKKLDQTSKLLSQESLLRKVYNEMVSH